MMGDWALIQDPSQWAIYKTHLEKLRHLTEPNHFPCLVRSKYDSSGAAWEHVFVYQEDAEMLFGAE